MRVMLNMLKIESKFRKCKKKKKKKKKIEQIFFITEINAREYVAIKCLCSVENTCHLQSTRQQIVLTFCISLRENFSNSIDFRLINKYGKGAVVQISTVFRPIFLVIC